MIESTLFDPSASTREPSEIHRLLAGDAVSQWMAIRVIKAEPGDAEVQMELRPDMLNGFGTAHGGIIFAFADSAFALACNHPTEDDGTITMAQGADVNFVRPAFAGQTLTARAKAVASGRSGVYDVEVLAQGADDPEPVQITFFRGRSRTIPRR